jgi:hypothetical protein
METHQRCAEHASAPRRDGVQGAVQRVRASCCIHSDATAASIRATPRARGSAPDLAVGDFSFFGVAGALADGTSELCYLVQ